MTEQSQTVAAPEQTGGGADSAGGQSSPRMFLTIPEVCRLIGRGENTVRSRLRKGIEGHHYRIATSEDSCLPGSTRYGSTIVPMEAASAILGTIVRVEDLEWDWYRSEWYDSTKDRAGRHDPEAFRSAEESHEELKRMRRAAAKAASNYAFVSDRIEAIDQEVDAEIKAISRSIGRLCNCCTRMMELRTALKELSEITPIDAIEGKGGDS